MGAFKRGLVRNAGAILSLCAFAAAAVILHRELKGYHLHDITRHFHTVPARALVAAFSLTLLNYLVLTGSEVLAMKYIRPPLPYQQLAFASFVGYVFSNNATLIGGSSVRYRVYSALGVSAHEVAKVVLFCGAGFWLGFLTLAGIVFIFDGRSVPMPQHLHLPFASTWILGMVFLAFVAAYVLATALLRHRSLNVLRWQLSVPSPGLTISQIVVSAFDWLLAAAVLYVLLPPGTHVTFGTFQGIFMLAQAAGSLSYVPGGLGVFETVLLLSLAQNGDLARGRDGLLSAQGP